MLALKYLPAVGFDDLLELSLGFFRFQRFAHDVCFQLVPLPCVYLL